LYHEPVFTSRTIAAINSLPMSLDISRDADKNPIAALKYFSLREKN